MPLLADTPQHRCGDLLDERGQAQARGGAPEHVIERRRVQRQRQREGLLGHCLRRVRLRVRRGGGSRLATGRARRRILGGDPGQFLGGEPGHLPDAASGAGRGVEQAKAGDVGVRVEPVLPLPARWLDGAVAPLPDAQEVLGQPRSVDDDRDRVAGDRGARGRRWRDHGSEDACLFSICQGNK
jgi:hypothetical protein